MIEYLCILLSLLNEIPSPQTTHIIILNGIRIFSKGSYFLGKTLVAFL